LRRHPFGMAKNSRLEIQGELVIREGRFWNSYFGVVTRRHSFGYWRKCTHYTFFKSGEFSECTLTRFSRNRL